jgi:predicted nuclease of predicted toxin-antitoxin system
MDASGSKLKKPSGANSPSKLPESPVFFLDRSLGKKRIATALRQVGAIVHIHDDYFPPDAKDEDWLAEAGRREWVVLTKDHRIRYRHVERLALMRGGVAAFILTSGDLQGDEMAQIFVKALPASPGFFRNTRNRSSPRSRRTVQSRYSFNKPEASAASGSYFALECPMEQ